MVSVTCSHKTYPFYHFPEISLSPPPSRRHWAKKAFNRFQCLCFFSIINTITDNHHHQSERQGRHKMDGLPSGYRPNVGVCLINSDNLVFVASRLNVPGAWQMPQGGIEDGEEPKSAAIRELMEETGIVSAEIVAEVPNWLTYDFPPAVKAKVNRLWGGEWHGQAQKW
ncbi:hypothetical protein NC653_025183 [Populus alba x Populus x berolinensis]|uniref:Nudix hydrolase domain-containing protein n=2 Tax=Populus TaxID=3689 RepID=A0AAD6Q9M2_9ROSI|nr:hypothetical protein NC653_025183 [Populus alba x Populus x berolinensis]